MYKSKLGYFIDLLRLKNPTGIMLLYLPCSFGVALNASSTHELCWYLVLFFIGSFFMRPAGCIINDICDARFDSQVERTKNRPIASNKISKTSAFATFALLSCGGLVILLQLSNLAIVIGLLSVPMFLIYPFMKRITYFPQLFLGLTFNIGALISAAAIKNAVDLYDLILYIGCVFWTLGYDTIYAFMDYKDDIDIGIKSSAIRFYRTGYHKLWISISYKIFYMALILSVSIKILGFPEFWFVVIMFICFVSNIYQIFKIDIYNSNQLLSIFKSNQISGMIILCSIIYIFKNKFFLEYSSLEHYIFI